MAVIGTSETIALHKKMAAMEVKVIRSQLQPIAFETGSISAAWYSPFRPFRVAQSTSQ